MQDTKSKLIGLIDEWTGNKSIANAQFATLILSRLCLDREKIVERIQAYNDTINEDDGYDINDEADFLVNSKGIITVGDE